MRATVLFLSALVCSAMTSCVGHAVTRPAATRPLGWVSAPPPAHDLPPLGAEEREIEGELRAVVSHLSGEVGERHPGKAWNLAEATDDLARRLEKLGYPVRRQGFAVGEEVAQNLEATVPGKEHGDESVIVCAHFDTAPGSPGADDDASGVSAVMSLARIFRDRKPSRAIRFVLFSNGAPPNARSAASGSLAYAKDLRQQGVRVSAVLNLQGLGYFSDAAGSQKQPASGDAAYPAAGSFVLVASDAREKELAARVMRELSAHGPLPVIVDGAAASFSDDWAFLETGMPVVTVTDTGPLRNPNHGRASDVPDTLDFGRMARLVHSLSAVIEELATGE